MILYFKTLYANWEKMYSSNIFAFKPCKQLTRIYLFGIQVPRKCRGKYGKRRVLSDDARLELSRDRNKEHARATRKRRRIFEAVLLNKIRDVQKNVSNVVGTTTREEIEFLKCNRRMLISRFFELQVTAQKQDLNQSNLSSVNI